MKRAFIGIGLIIGLSGISFGATTESLNSILLGTQRAYSLIAENGYETVLIVTGSIKYKEERCEYRTLTAGVTYTISAVGGDGLTDLDLELYGESGNLVGRDGQNDLLPIVTYTPEKTQTFKINVIAYDVTPTWKNSYNSYSLLISVKN